MNDDDELKAIRKEVSQAERIVFLGFHFHDQNMQLLMTSGPGGRVGEVFATAIYRSPADVNIIDKQISDMVRASGGSWKVMIERHMGCKELFREFATTMAR